MRAARRSRAAYGKSIQMRNRRQEGVEEDDTCLVLDTAGLHLVAENLCAGLLGLGFVNVFHEDALVLEDVAL